MKFFALLVVLGVLQSYAAATPEGHYSIISPGTVHPNSRFNVAVSVQQVAEACKVKLALEGPRFEKSIEVEVQPMTVENVEFQIPDVEAGTWQLHAEGLAGLIFTNSTELNFDENKPAVYIQTDKATYKPGDLVQFRVIFLDEHTRPSKIAKPVTVFIKDAANNRVKQFSNIQLTKGVFSNKTQLSEFPLLGAWTIDVQIDGSTIYKKNFDVAKYVLPKFQVLIDAPKKIAIQDETLGFIVRTKYTFGTLVAGKTTVTIKSHKFNMPISSIPNYPMREPMPHPRTTYPPHPSWVLDNTNGRATLHMPAVPSTDFWRPAPSFNPSLIYRHPQTFSTEKTIGSNGKLFVEFKIKELLPDGIGNGIPDTLDIFVESEEELTGKKQNASAVIKVVQNRFHLNSPNVNVDCNDAETKFNFTATVTNLNDEPVSDAKNAVTFQPSTRTSVKLPIETAYLNRSGVAYVTLVCKFHNDSTIDVVYEGQRSYGTVIVKKASSGTPLLDSVTKLNVRVLTKDPQLDEDIEVQVRSPVPLSYFIYTVIARGNVVKSDLIRVPESGNKSHTFKIRTTFEMVPSAKIYVHYIQDHELKFHESSFNVEKDFLNSIAITAPPQTAPGGTIAIKVRTDPASYVGLLGVDQSVLLLKSGNDFDGDAIVKGVEAFKSTTPKDYLDTIFDYPGGSSGVVTMTNAHYPFQRKPRYELYMRSSSRIPYRAGGGAFPLAFNSPIPHMYHMQSAELEAAPAMAMYSAPFIPFHAPPKPPQIRKNFLETWFFDDITQTVHSPDANSFVIMKKLPDTITSWVVTGFALSPETGFALTKYPTHIKTFRPFFVTTNLPYAVKRDEQVEVPLIVFNYLSEPLEAEVTMSNEDGEFEFLEPTANETTCVKRLTVSPNNGETISFTIRPQKLGHISLKVSALSALAGDAINRKLKVKPAGITVFKNRDFYLHAEHGEFITTDNVSLDIPADVVLDSEHIEVAVMGDILGSTITNIDQLVRMPSGCGEQNMVNFVPNILVLRYLESIHQLSPAIEEKAKNFLEIGYQRELSYRHDNGAYSAFGKSDSAGSTWLTAYVMRSFHQAAKYIDIDANVLEQGLHFLASIQAANGSFPEIGKVLDFSHYNDVGLTAFVLLAFLENNEHLTQYEETIQRGFKYLEENVQNTEDLYALSIAVYALQVHKSATVPELLKKLDIQAKIDGGHKWWTKAVEVIRTDQSWRPKSHDVEVTGYIMMTLLEMNEPVLPVTKWLISQRNSNGGFSSTQETVVGLQALIKFAEKTSGADTELTIEVGAGETLKKFSVNPSNALALQTFVLQNTARELTFTASGRGAAILQISYQYNIQKKENQPSFKLEIKQENKSKREQLSLNICAEFVPLENEIKESNMVVMEVALPSGYVADKESFGNLKQVESVKRVESKNGETTVVVYLDSLEATKVKCMPIEAALEHTVRCQKPAAVVIYDYYDNQKRATEFYQVDSKCEDDKNGK